MGIIDVAFAVGGGLVTNLIYGEVTGRAGLIAAACVRRAAATLPRKLQELFLEEWSADLLDQPTPISQLIFGLGLLLAGHRIMASERQRVSRIVVQRRLAVANVRLAQRSLLLFTLQFYDGYDLIKAGAAKRGTFAPLAIFHLLFTPVLLLVALLKWAVTPRD